MDQKWKVITITSVGTFMSGLNARIVIVGLPQVAAALQADAEQAIWFTQAYVLGSTIFLLLVGKLTDVTGRRRISTVGFALFTIGSLLSGLSFNPSEVIFFRAVQGLGSAVIITNSFVLARDVDPKNLGFMLGINQVAWRAGAISAVVISGAIISFFDWRALFFLNVPVGIIGTFLVAKYIKDPVMAKNNSGIDWVGFITFTVSATTLLLGLTYSAYPTGSPMLVLSFYLVSIASFVVFLIQERKAIHPMVDLRLFRIRRFSFGVTMMLLNACSWGAVLLLLSLYFQLVRGFSPLQAGLYLLPFELSYLLTGPLCGRLSDRYGSSRFVLSGLVIQAAAVLLFATMSSSSSLYVVACYLATFGVGTGLYTSPANRLVISSVPAEITGIASATSQLFWNIGFTVSLNLAIILMTTAAPYSLISAVLSSSTTASFSVSLFLSGIKYAYIGLGLLDLVAIVPAAFAMASYARST